MEQPQHIVMLYLAPDHLTLMRPTAHPPRKRHLILPEGPHRRVGRAGTSEGAKEEVDRVLHLPIRVEYDAVIIGIAEADR